MSIPSEVKEFYDQPELVGEWKGYQVYANSFGKDAPAIGLPEFVLYKDGKAKLTTEDEAFDFIKTLPDD